MARGRTGSDRPACAREIARTPARYGSSVSRSRMSVATAGKTILGLRRMIVVMTAVACMAGASSCAGGAHVATTAQLHSPYVSRPAPNSHVLLVPELRGGRAGWCLATGYQTTTEGSGGCGEVTTTSTEPIFSERGCDESETGIHELRRGDRDATHPRCVAGGHRRNPKWPSGAGRTARTSASHDSLLTSHPRGRYGTES